MVMFLMICRRELKFLICSSAMAVAILYIASKHSAQEIQEILRDPKSNEFLSIPDKHYLIQTPGCTIDYVELTHPAIKRFLQHWQPLKCKAISPLVKAFGNILQVAPMQMNFSCYYNVITRHNESTSHISEVRTTFQDEIKVLDEFVVVKCENNTGHNIYEDYFAFIQKKSVVEKRCQKIPINESNQHHSIPRIVLLGLDSVSKNQFLRYMPETLKFLRGTLNTVEFHGFNKVGRNTYPNLIALLTGKKENDVIDTEKYSADNISFIWKDFARMGYRTLFNEDDFAITAFNYGRKGFNASPTDYYYRPFVLAMEASKVMNTDYQCINERLESLSILQWTRDFLDVFREDKLFAFTYLTRFSHASLNGLGHLDKPVYEFFKYLHSNNHLNNTIVFLYGDHGMRFGQFRNTYIGRIEEKLPLFTIILPPDFQTRFPAWYQALKTNAHRLISHFDIYHTLQHLLNPSYDMKSVNSTGVFGSTLFQEISPHRTCDDAGIMRPWCACDKWQTLTIFNEFVKKAAVMLVDAINAITEPWRTKCLSVKLVTILQARAKITNMGEEWERHNATYYQLTIEVSPSKGQFEGNVWYNGEINDYEVDKSIDRVNMYGNQSVCVDNAKLKPFCYCKR